MRFILAVLLVSLTFTDAHPQQVPPREIELKLLPVDVTDGVPTGFTFVLTNVSNEDLRVPPPNIDCSNPTPQGTLWLQESWVPVSGDGMGKGMGICDRGGVYPKPPVTIEALTRTWTMLRPGESLRVTASSKELHYDFGLPGTYTFFAKYIPPQLSPDEELLLSDSGIVIPRQTVTSPDQHYVKPPSQP